MKPNLPVLLSALSLTSSLSAATLMLDFGPTAAIDDVGTPNSLVNSPYHSANGSFTDSKWNTVGSADVAAGQLSWSDNTTATGVALNIGATTAPGTTLGLGNTPSLSIAGTSVNTSGIYAGTSVGKDGISTGTGTRAVGFQLSGLPAGTYDIYLTGRNTNTTAAHIQNLYVGKSASSGNFDFSAYSTGQLSYDGSSDATSNWVVGDNYVKLSISITSGEFLNIASYGGTGETRGFLNSVQIVSTIPEPSTYAALAGSGGLLIALLRRRKPEAR